MSSKNLPNLQVVNPATLDAMHDRLGWFSRMQADAGMNRANKNALLAIAARRALGIEEIAITSLTVAATEAKAAIVSAAMPRIGALAVRLNNEIAAIDQALTDGCAGEVLTHLDNRDANTRAIAELAATGKISNDEAVALSSLVTADAAQDIQRARDRMDHAKHAVGDLHGLALRGIHAADEQARAQLTAPVPRKASRPA